MCAGFAQSAPRVVPLSFPCFNLWPRPIKLASTQGAASPGHDRQLQQLLEALSRRSARAWVAGTACALRPLPAHLVSAGARRVAAAADRAAAAARDAADRSHHRPDAPLSAA